MVWDANWISALGAVVSALMAAVSAYIAYTAKKVADRQNESSRLQINLGLYDKRYRIYNSAKQFITEVVRDGCGEYNKILEFKEETFETLFLFRDDMCEYMVTIIKNAEKIDELNIKLGYHEVSECEKKSILDERESIYEWFNKQLMEQLHEKFLDYLDFTNINVQGQSGLYKFNEHDLIKEN